MPTPNEVKAALSNFIVRVAKGEAVSPAETEALDDVARVYLEHFAPQPPERKAADGFRPPQAAEETPRYVPPRDPPEDAAARPQAAGADDGPFPLDGLVSGIRAARFLGISDFKHPERAVRRLAAEGKISGPICDGGRRYRYKAQEIRAYKERIEAETERKVCA